MITKSLPLYIQAYQLLKEEIILGIRKPGEKLIESKLSSELGISRGPIREALRMIEHDGLVVSNDMGLIVNPMNVQDVREVWHCRIANEPYAARLAIDHITDSKIEELKEIIRESIRLRRENNLKLYAETTAHFHNTITSLCGNKYLIEIIDRISSLVLYSRTLEFIRYGPREGMDEEHMYIIELLEKRDKNRIESYMREHFIRDWEYNYSFWEDRIWG